MMKTDQEISALLRRADVVVSYSPLADEPDAESFLSLHGFGGQVVHTPKDKDASPKEFATLLQDLHKEKNVCILVPGRKFDTTGTRHGRGGGWYDRFLDALPKDWVKIGLALPHHISEKTLERKTHDQPMDYVLVCEGDEWKRF